MANKKQYHYNKSELIEAFCDIGLKKGDVVFCHSNVGFLGCPEEAKNPETIFNFVLESFFDVMGNEGTLVIPTFSYSFCQGKDFDIKNTPSTVGVFTEFVRKHPKSVRSLEPLFSVSAIGPKASKLLSNLSSESFGKDSIWDRLLKEDAAVLNIGIGVGCTFIHYVEQMLNVPYRYKKLFTGNVIVDGKKSKRGIIYFVRDLNYHGAAPNWGNLDRDARADGVVRARIVGKGEVNLIRCQRMFELCEQGLKKNSSYLVNGLTKEDDTPENKPIKLADNDSMMEIINKLWELPRDIVSDGYDTALYSLSSIYGMKIHKYPTGTECWTWLIPEKWACREAYLETLSGKRIFSYSDNPLHVISYSLPYEGIVTKEELFDHLYTHPINPEAIPFKFKYYDRDWGLCCSQNIKKSLIEDKYKVKIKTEFSFGELKVGEVFVPGKTAESIVLCAHLCHPAMVNDDLTGVVVGLEVMRRLRKKKGLYYTYRFLIGPETIGSIAWLSHNEDLIPKIKGGLFLEMLGTDFPHYSMQLSFMGNTQIDKCFINTVKSYDPDAWIGAYRSGIDNDERQFNAPGVRVPMLSLSRVNPPEDGRYIYPEYHTNFDNPSIISEKKLEEAVNLVLKMIDNLENNYYVINNFKGEIFCSRYGIHIDYYEDPEGNKKMFEIIERIDGARTLADIATECRVPFESCRNLVFKLKQKGLVEYGRRPII